MLHYIIQYKQNLWHLISLSKEIIEYATDEPITKQNGEKRMNRKNKTRRTTFKRCDNMKLFRHTIYQIYCRIINSENRIENARIQHIRDEISGTEKRQQILKDNQYSNRTKTSEIKKTDFSKNTLPTQTGTSLTRDLQTVPLTEILYGK